MRVRLWLIVGLALLLALPTPARAEVEVTFWSHRADRNFPHAFLVMQGTVDATGEVVDARIGFTAFEGSSAIVWKSVDGTMQSPKAEYMARTTTRPQFTLRLQDEEFARLVLFIDLWRAQAQPNYNLERRNCVHFVMGAASALGLRVNRKSRNFRAPHFFLKEVMRLNDLVAVTAP